MSIEDQVGWGLVVFGAGVLALVAYLVVAAPPRPPAPYIHPEACAAECRSAGLPVRRWKAGSPYLCECGER